MTGFHWSSILSRGVLFSCIWWVLAGDVAQSWSIGAPAVLLATVVSAVLVPPTTIVWHELLRFIPFFLWRSLLGGVDVAWRALRPGRSIAPALVEYRLRLPPGLPQIFLANVITMLPGTLSAELADNTLRVHVLNERNRLLYELSVVEQRVASMFGVLLTAREGGTT